MSRKVQYSSLALTAGTILIFVGWAFAASSPSSGEAKCASCRTAAPAASTGLEGLSPADRAAAEKQKVCPVSDERLGAMGTPVKLTVKGRDVFLCCGGCKAKFLKDVDFYLKKIDKQAK